VVALSHSEQDFGSKISAVGQIEHHLGLSRAYRQLSKAYLQKSDITSAQSTAELSTFADQLALLSKNAFIAKETLTTRHFLIREYINAQTASRTKYAALQRMKSGTKIDEAKVDEALGSYEDAKAKEGELQQKVARVTGNLLHERGIWNARIAKDGKTAVREYVERMIEIERRTLGALEVIRPDIRNIDASGGLSWLGRESHKSVAKTRPDVPPSEGRSGGSMGVNQGPRGDAWSGVERRRSYRRDSTSGGPVREREEDSVQDDEVEEGKLDARSAAMMLSTQL
jgi:Vps5 C terminal like